MQTTNFRDPVLSEPRIFGGQYGLNTPVGIVTSNQPPPLPPRPMNNNLFPHGNAYGGRMGLSAFGYPAFGSGYGGYSYGGGYGGYGSYGGYNGVYGNSYNYGNPGVPEYRFIQMAEESSRPAFQNIEFLVGAISNIAAMLDSTFFALTSSFRAILGVAANFAHLRGVFAQFWTSFALFRWIIWLYKKILYLLNITKTDPTTENFKEAFKLAETDRAGPTQNKVSSMPVLLFLGFIISAPYLLMKVFNGGNSTDQAAKNPSTWKNPVEAVAMFNFDGTNPTELTIRKGQTVTIAPKSVQIENNLLNTGWVLATVDNATCGLIPVNYLQGSKQQQLQQSDNKVLGPKEETIA